MEHPGQLGNAQYRAFFMVVRIMMLISGTFLLTYTTSPILLTDGLESLLGPLKKIRARVMSFSAIYTAPPLSFSRMAALACSRV